MGKFDGVLLVSDFDDTLYDSHCQVPRRNLEALDRFLDGLPPRQREVFLRRYWYLDSIEDIARRTGWSKSRVTTTLHRLRVRLRAHLIQEGIDI